MTKRVNNPIPPNYRFPRPLAEGMCAPLREAERLADFERLGVRRAVTSLAVETCVSDDDDRFIARYTWWHGVVCGISGTCLTGVALFLLYVSTAAAP